MRGPRVFVFLGAVIIFGCGNRGNPEPASVETVAATTAEADDSADTPRQIYYNLTRYGWYQRAEPLAFAQQRYMPRGAPIVIPLAKLRLAGNYQGVDFYVLHTEEEPPTTLYVPVYERYWLSFVAAPTTTD